MPKLTAKEQYSNVITEINSKLSDVLNPIRSSVKEFYKYHNKIDIKEIKPCDLFERQPKYSSGDEVIGNTAIDEVLEEIRNDPDRYRNLQEINPDIFNQGRGKGDLSDRVEIKRPVYPEWIKKIDTEAKLFFRRGKTKEYYDEESLTRGVPRRKKVKKYKREKSLFVLLDVSGSMWSGTWRGVPLIELMIRFFPAIANQFEGELWEVDYGSPSVIIPLKQLRGSAVKEMSLHGGGGTNYDESFALINDKKKLLGLEGKTADFMTIVFTDGDVKWNPSVMPDNLIIVAPKAKERTLPPDNEEKNWKSILIDVDSNQG